jgi:hypothetical protein
MGWCKGNFAAVVRLNTPSRQVTHMHVTFGSRNLWRHFLTVPTMFPS